jgi:hypothetical protein
MVALERIGDRRKRLVTIVHGPYHEVFHGVGCRDVRYSEDPTPVRQRDPTADDDYLLGISPIVSSF